MKFEDAKSLVLIGAVLGIGFLLWKLLKNGEDSVDDFAQGIADWWVGESEVQLAFGFKLPSGQVIDPAKTSRRWEGDVLYATYNGTLYRVLQRDSSGNYVLTRV